jgi:hypothetical protein
MGAVLVRTLLDYWAPADISSVAELVTYLDGTCSHAGLAALLDVGPGGDADEDACTDSDDESSEDDGHTGAQVEQGSARKPAGADGRRTPEAAAVAAATAALAEAHSQVVNTSSQVVALLSRCVPMFTAAAAATEEARTDSSSLLAARATSVENVPAPAGINSVIAALSALTSNTSSTMAVASSVGNMSESKRSACSLLSKGRSTAVNSTQSCDAQSTTTAAKAAKAATDLLEKVVAARARMPTTFDSFATAEASTSPLQKHDKAVDSSRMLQQGHSKAMQAAESADRCIATPSSVLSLSGEHRHTMWTN